MNCCVANGDCRQGRDCPARVAKVKACHPVDHSPQPTAPLALRNHLDDLNVPLRWRDLAGVLIVLVVAAVAAAFYPS